MSQPLSHILIVEDDPTLGVMLQDLLEMEGYGTTVAADGEAALAQLMQQPGFDLVLLDVMLPMKNGFEVLHEARRRGITVPVVVVTACGEGEDLLQGFDLGADDYVKKPFNAEELLARVEVILKRTQPPYKAPMDIHRIGDVEINFSTHEAFRQGKKLHCTAMEFDLLRYLIVNRGRTVSRSALLRDVWRTSQAVVTRTVDRHMASLRKKIEPQGGRPTYIETIYGVGYRLVGSR